MTIVQTKSDLIELIDVIASNIGKQLTAKKKEVEEAYQCLFLDSSSSEEQVNSRIRGLTRVYHPDKGGSHDAFIKFKRCASLIREARLQPHL